MSLAILKNQLKSGQFSRLYFFYGEESYLMLFYRNAILKKLINPETAGFNYYVFENRNLTVAELSDCVENYPVMSDYKMVVIKDLNFSKKNDVVNYLVENANNLPDYLTIVIYQETIETDIKSTEIKRLLGASKNFTAVEFEKASDTELIDWILRHFNSQKKNISRTDAEYLLSICTGSMNLLKTEIDKLCSYSVTSDVTKKHINALVSPSIEYKAYFLTEAVIKKDINQTMHLIGELYNMKYDDIIIASTIYKAFIDLYAIKVGLEAGKTASAISQATGLRDFVVKKYIPLISHVNSDYLAKCIEKCCKCDFDLRNTKLDNRIVIEKLIGEIILMGNKNAGN